MVFCQLFFDRMKDSASPPLSKTVILVLSLNVLDPGFGVLAKVSKIV